MADSKEGRIAGGVHIYSCHDDVSECIFKYIHLSNFFVEFGIDIF